MPTENAADASASWPPARGADVRRACRSGGYRGPTAGLAPGYVQGNLVVLPHDWADEFLRFCQANPKPCPGADGVGTGERGTAVARRRPRYKNRPPRLSRLARRKSGREPSEVVGLWRADLVSFVIWCSFTFEEPLIAAGIPIRHIARRCTVSMYPTNVPTTPAGRFCGPLVVSMRPLKPADVIRAVQITSRLPAVHGAPVHIGFPESIGITDLAKPDFGDAVPIEPDELPVFWACGVTPQAAIAAARPPFALTHAPGCMLVTDLKNAQLAAI